MSQIEIYPDDGSKPIPETDPALTVKVSSSYSSFIDKNKGFSINSGEDNMAIAYDCAGNAIEVKIADLEYNKNKKRKVPVLTPLQMEAIEKGNKFFAEPFTLFRGDN